VDAVFYYEYYDYAALNGTINWMNGKPVVGARYQLWLDGGDDPQSLALKLNQLPRDVQSVSSYSLIPVHPWGTMNYSDIVTTISLLDPAIRVVSPQDFVTLLQANIPQHSRVPI